ncbi:MAG: CoA transferase [Alphaproteobacteria bacterium]
MVTQKDKTGLLSGLRIIELGHAVAVPFGTSLLSDFGAEIIKIEDPTQGDMCRDFGPKKNGVGLWWKVTGRNKKCVTLNLKDPRGVDLCKRLIATADAVVENFRPGVLKRLGLGNDVLRSIKPDLVITSVSGYGQTGPFSDRPGFGKVGEAMGGVMNLTGEVNGAPLAPGFSFADCCSGMFSALSTMMALYHRDAMKGVAATLDIGLFEPIQRMIEWQVIVADQLGIVAKRSGARFPLEGSGFSNCFPCRDGKWVMISAASATVVRRVLNAIDTAGALAKDPRFATDDALLKNLDGLDSEARTWIAARDRDPVITRFTEVGAVCGPIYDAADIMADPQVLAREDVIEIDDPDLGKTRMVGVVPKVPEAPGRVRWAGPALGAHNHEVFASILGLKAAEIDQLRAAGIV